MSQTLLMGVRQLNCKALDKSADAYLAAEPYAADHVRETIEAEQINVVIVNAPKKIL